MAHCSVEVQGKVGENRLLAWIHITSVCRELGRTGSRQCGVRQVWDQACVGMVLCNKCCRMRGADCSKPGLFEIRYEPSGH